MHASGLGPIPEILMNMDKVLKAVLCVAALLAAGTYAWNTFMDRAEPVQAAGVDSSDGFAVEGFGFNRQGGFICVTRKVANPFETNEQRYTMTFYELIKTGGDGDAKLHLLGSRCIEYDQGPDLVKFEEIKGESPKDLKDAVEKFNKGRKKGSASKKSAEDD
jgi:hypothetical protein